MQSHTQEENLYGEPFSVFVTGVKSSGLPKQRRTGGRGKRRFIHKIRRNINDASIIQINNDDQYCLFYALKLNASTHQRKFFILRFQDIKKISRGRKLSSKN